VIGHAKGVISEITPEGYRLQIPEAWKNGLRKVLTSYLTKEEGKRPVMELTMKVECEILGTKQGGIINVGFIDLPDVYLEVKYREAAKAQITTLRGLERFIFWATEGYKSRGDRDIFYIHEAIIEQFSREVVNPLTGQKQMMRTSDPNMDTKTMARMIEGALNWLMTLDIPDEVQRVAGKDMKELWENWYKWRYSQGEKDPLFDEERTYTWEAYQEVHPVCELCGLPAGYNDPLERMHIISAGADGTIYEEPWNWLHSHRSHHALQHNEGWENVVKAFPVIKDKITRARAVWDRKGRR
jgi:hypothetical protein